ncbi:MAG: hypothetical protein CMJ78_01415 [Planctomycetaceae bacterium]|nr:hypothetical protein [Planctomycetaceae bacterium]
MQCQFQAGDKWVAANFSIAKIHTTPNELCGNVDLTVSCDPPLEFKAMEPYLRLRVAGDSGLADILGYGKKPDGLELIFTSEWVSDNFELPESVEVVWTESGEEVLGSLDFEEASDDGEHSTEESGSGCAASVLLMAVLSGAAISVML